MQPITSFFSISPRFGAQTSPKQALLAAPAAADSVRFSASATKTLEPGITYSSMTDGYFLSGTVNLTHRTEPFDKEVYVEEGAQILGVLKATGDRGEISIEKGATVDALETQSIADVHGTVKGHVKAQQGIYIQKSANIVGSVETNSHMDLFGMVRGDVKAEDDILITKDAIVGGNAESGNEVTIEGRVRRDVKAKNDISLAPNAVVGGNITTENSAFIDGMAMGNVIAKNTVFLTKGALALEDVVAHEAVIDGKVMGDVTAEKTVQIGKDAIILGTITAEKIIDERPAASS